MEKTPPQLSASWSKLLEKEFESAYMEELKRFLSLERKGSKEIFPPSEEVFSAFSYKDPGEVKVIIVGQDPYHGKGQAHGLSFSVKPAVPLPPSLQNIYKELKSDLGIEPASTGTLIPWAKQGVLLLNATLTVRQGEPLSHFGKGWEQFTDSVILRLAEREEPLVFLLWGKSAQQKVEKLTLKKKPQHLLLTAPHPSPFSAHTGFLGCRHFSKANDFLKSFGVSPIDWSLKFT